MDFETPKRKTYTPQQALLKAESYCAYQERSQQEMRDKLYHWGLHQTEVEHIISTLIETNFLNEERFALTYAQGKFRIKGWGKRKIKQALKLKRVPEKLINKALNQLNAEEYVQKLGMILEKKAALLKEKDAFKRRYQLSQFAQQRGFEPDLITDVLKDKGLN